MIFTSEIIEALEELEPNVRQVFVRIFKALERSLGEVVKREDFLELKKVVQELAQAQKQSEQRLSRLEQTVQELAEAQKRTEQRLEELAQAQKRTEEELRKLASEHAKTIEQVGGLSHTVGYILEDKSYKALPILLKQDMGVEIIGRLKRDFIEIGKDRYIEVNIWGRGRINGTECVIVGEAKTQLKKKDIDDFIKRADEIKKYVKEQQIRLLVTYHASPQVMKYAQEKNIKLYFSYEF